MEDLLPRQWWANGICAVVPFREELIQYAILFCSLCVLIQLAVVWGTKWGDRQLFAKSFLLSLFLHVCLVLNWYSYSQVGRAAPPTREEPIPHQQTERVPIEVRTEPIEEDFIERTDSSHLGVKRPTTQVEVPRNRSESSAQLEEPQRPSTINHEGNRSLTNVEIPMIRGDVADPVTFQMQPPTSPRVSPLQESTRLQTADDPSPDVAESPPSSAARRKSRQRAESGTASESEPATPDRVRPSASRQSKKSPIIDNGADIPGIVNNGETRRSETPDLDVPLIRRPPPVEEIRKQPAKSEFVASGLVTNAMTGKPIAGVTIRVDQISIPSLKTTTEHDGSYRIALSDLPDNFAITASVDEFIPMSKNLSRGERNALTPRTDFQLQPSAPTVVVVEENPEVHHVGDDRFEGLVNSQFQRKSEGASVTLRFEISQNAQQLQQVRGVVRFLAKGIQCSPDIRINRTALTEMKRLSAEDGSFGSVEVPFRSELLREGPNSIEIRSTQCAADLDDFEFVNVQIRLEPRE